MKTLIYNGWYIVISTLYLSPPSIFASQGFLIRAASRKKSRSGADQKPLASEDGPPSKFIIYNMKTLVIRPLNTFEPSCPMGKKYGTLPKKSGSLIYFRKNYDKLLFNNENISLIWTSVHVLYLNYENFETIVYSKFLL